MTYDYEYEDKDDDDDDDDDDYEDYYEEKTIVKTVVAKPKRPAATPRPQPPASSSGAQFLGQVEGLLGAAEQNLDLGREPHITLTGSLREALLR